MPNDRRLNNLPPSEHYIWENAEVMSYKPRDIPICDHSKKNWMNGSYVDNHDGTITCQSCPWGARLSGRYRILDGKVVDLKDYSSQ